NPIAALSPFPWRRYANPRKYIGPYPASTLNSYGTDAAKSSTARAAFPCFTSSVAPNNWQHNILAKGIVEIIFFKLNYQGPCFLLCTCEHQRLGYRSQDQITTRDGQRRRYVQLGLAVIADFRFNVCDASEKDCLHLISSEAF